MYVEIDIEVDAEKRDDSLEITAGKRITEQRIGTGRRRLVVVSEGDRWVVLYNPFNCESVRIPVELYDHWNSRPIEITPRLIEIAERNIRDRQRLGIDDGGVRGQKAMQILRG